MMWLILCRNPAVSLGEHKAKNNICFSFAFCVLWLLQVFNRYPMRDPRIAVASCIEHERLAALAQLVEHELEHGCTR